MKPIFKSLIVLTTLILSTSCGDDPVVTPGTETGTETTYGKPTTVSVNVDAPQSNDAISNSRVAYESAEVVKWSLDDKISVFASDGTNVGTLTLTSGEDSSSATFSGEVTVSEQLKYTFTFPAIEGDLSTRRVKTSGDVQPTDGSISHLSELCYMKASNIAYSSASKSFAATTLQHETAIYQFVISRPSSYNTQHGNAKSFTVTHGESISALSDITAINNWVDSADDFTVCVAVDPTEVGNSKEIKCEITTENEEIYNITINTDPTFEVSGGSYITDINASANDWHLEGGVLNLDNAATEKTMLLADLSATAYPLTVNEWYLADIAIKGKDGERNNDGLKAALAAIDAGLTTAGERVITLDLASRPLKEKAFEQFGTPESKLRIIVKSATDKWVEWWSFDKNYYLQSVECKSTGFWNSPFSNCPNLISISAGNVSNLGEIGDSFDCGVALFGAEDGSARSNESVTFNCDMLESAVTQDDKTLTYTKNGNSYSITFKAVNVGEIPDELDVKAETGTLLLSDVDANNYPKSATTWKFDTSDYSQLKEADTQTLRAALEAIDKDENDTRRNGSITIDVGGAKLGENSFKKFGHSDNNCPQVLRMIVQTSSTDWIDAWAFEDNKYITTVISEACAINTNAFRWCDNFSSLTVGTIKAAIGGDSYSNAIFGGNNDSRAIDQKAIDFYYKANNNSDKVAISGNDLTYTFNGNGDTYTYNFNSVTIRME